VSPEEQSCKLECHDLIVRFFTIIDTGPLASFKDLFTEDGKLLRGGAGFDPGPLVTGRPNNMFPIHLVTNMLVTQTGPETADGEAYVVAYNMKGDPADTLPRKMPQTPNRIGKSIFEFRKTAAGWRIFSQTNGHHFVDDFQDELFDPRRG
jgi:hypothetical protein